MIEETQQTNKSWYDKSYKYLLLLTIIALAITLIYLISFYKQNNDIIRKDITLTGGTTLTVYQEINLAELDFYLTKYYEEFSLREISDLRTGKQEAFILEVSAEPDQVTKIIEDYLGIKLTEKNSSIEFTGPALSQGFYTQIQTALILAFILMSVVVFLIFRTFVPGFAVILSAFADIAMTIAVVNFLGINVSSAGIVAFLMLIGYSVDSDILLTTRLLKSRDSKLNSRLFSAFKTGMTMTLTSAVAVLISLAIIFTLSQTLTQIFTIIFIGLMIDLFNTWITNASILKWYCDKKEIK